jgi:outer membrane protein OmpA-like peptidoglycan-associated protein
MKRCALPCLLCVLALAACKSPPRPPGVDESTRRPVNAGPAVDLQICRNELQNTRILSNESLRAAEVASATATRLALQQQALAAMAAAGPHNANAVYTVLFPYGSTAVAVPEPDATHLADAARRAPLILLRGRTDGNAESLAEGRIARERAAAVRSYLVQAGVEPARIRSTYQPVGDHAADNASAGGRALNRRVEIELYRHAPQPLALNAGQRY